MGGGGGPEVLTKERKRDTKERRKYLQRRGGNIYPDTASTNNKPLTDVHCSLMFAAWFTKGAGVVLV